eukprot:1482158-Pleurochrysis_carterae.AAC.1
MVQGSRTQHTLSYGKQTRAKAAGGGKMTFDETKRTKMPPIRSRRSRQAPADHSLQLAHAGEQ